MKPTRIRDLWAIYAVVAVGVGAIAYTNYERLPRLQITAPISLLLLAAFVGFTAPATRARLDGRPGTKPIMAILVARYAALAKASSAAAAVAAGIWTGIFSYAAAHRDSYRYAGTDAVLAAVGVAAAGLLVVAALRLENACRARRPPDARDDAGSRL